MIKQPKCNFLLKNAQQPTFTNPKLPKLWSGWLCGFLCYGGGNGKSFYSYNFLFIKYKIKINDRDTITIFGIIVLNLY